MSATLYYTPSSCGAASYIAAHKAGLIADGRVKAYEADIGAHKILAGPHAGKSFYDINPKGNVPALVLEDGTLLNEGAAVLQWIADQKPEANLAPANGTTARYVVQSKLNYLASEVHTTVGPLFNPSFKGEARDAQVEKLKTKFKYLAETELQGGKKHFLTGAGEGAFTIADSYLYIILTWLPYLGIDIAKESPVLAAYKERVGSLDFVKEAHAAMAAASPAK